MSDSVQNGLKLLGLAHGASWNEINQAYRDLVRVWHPDRFEMEPRLKVKAGEQTRELNLAMQLLRKEYDPNKKPQSKPEPRREASPNWFKAAMKPAPSRGKNIRYLLRPFLVHQRIRTSLYRFAGASLMVSLGAFILGSGEEQPVSMATGSIFALLGLQGAIRHSFLLIFRRPVLRVDQIGIQGIDTGMLSWRDVSRVWSVRFGGQICLAIEYSEEYLRYLPLARRLLLHLRHLIRKSHIIISCAGLDHHPNDVVRAVEAQHMIGTIEPKKVERLENSKKYLFSKIIAAGSVTSILIRSLFGLQTSLVELSVYIAIFLMCETYSFTIKVFKVPA